MDRQEIRRLLEKARFELPVISTNIPTRKLIGESLDLLEQQPTAVEWTKLWRERLENSITLYKIGKSPDEWFSSIVTGFQEACDRLDRAEAINKELLDACLKIQTARNEYRQTGKEFDYKELDKTLDAAITRATKEG